MTKEGKMIRLGLVNLPLSCDGLGNKQSANLSKNPSSSLRNYWPYFNLNNFEKWEGRIECEEAKEDLIE